MTTLSVVPFISLNTHTHTPPHTPSSRNTHTQTHLNNTVCITTNARSCTHIITGHALHRLTSLLSTSNCVPCRTGGWLKFNEWIPSIGTTPTWMSAIWLDPSLIHHPHIELSVEVYLDKWIHHCECGFYVWDCVCMCVCWGWYKLASVPQKNIQNFTSHSPMKPHARDDLWNWNMIFSTVCAWLWHEHKHIVQHYPV